MKNQGWKFIQLLITFFALITAGLSYATEKPLPLGTTAFVEMNTRSLLALNSYFPAKNFDWLKTNYQRQMTPQNPNRKSIGSMLTPHLTYSLHWGRKTDKVYIFIPGLGLDNRYFRKAAEAYYRKGNNVILAYIPTLLEMNTQYVGIEALWLQYADALAAIAKNYGDETIVIGQSLGGQLAVRMAESHPVEQLVLIQPLIKAPSYHEGLAEFARRLLFSIDSQEPNREQNSTDQQFGFYRSFILSMQACQRLSDLENWPLASNTKVKIYLYSHDIAVDNEATMKWSNSFNHSTEIEKTGGFDLLKGHLAIPSRVEMGME